MRVVKRFQNRHDAGRQLAAALWQYRDRPDQVVLALPRGGVPVAFEVARSLNAPLGLLIVRKIGAPGQPELAIGAVASGGVVIHNDEIIRMLGVSDEALARATRAAEEELAAKERLYGTTAAGTRIDGRTVFLVDDGAATGATMRAAVAAAKARAAARVVVALPTAAAESAATLSREADELVCIETPEPYLAVGYWYVDFQQVADTEVRQLVDRARSAPATGA